MKPFDLIAAKNGAPVCTRDGLKVEILKFDLKNCNYPIVALITLKDGSECIKTYTNNGKFSVSVKEDNIDLMMAPIKHKGWINVYYNSVYETGISIYSTKEEAENKATDEVVDTVCIEWEE